MGFKANSPGTPEIVSQPANQNTRVGQTATFSVTVKGTAPFSYQWSRNGVAIAGAATQSYTTPTVVATDNGAIFAVTISNVGGSVTSSSASLNVGARAPNPADWRFQGIDLPGSSSMLGLFNLLGSSAASLNFLGTPIQLAVDPGDVCFPGVAFDCSWAYAWSALPSGVSGLTTNYRSDAFTNLQADLNLLNAPNIVIMGLDLEPEDQVFAISWLQLSRPSGFQLNTQTVALSDFPTVASQLGTESQVITAVSYNPSDVFVVSYAWQGDTKTTYDVNVVSATSDNFVTQAATLASSGYILTAIGSNPVAGGLLIVGERVQGDHLPRPFTCSSTGTCPVQGQIASNVQTLSREIADAGPNANAETWLSEQ